MGGDGNQLFGKVPKWICKLMLHPLPGPPQRNDAVVSIFALTAWLWAPYIKAISGNVAVRHQSSIHGAKPAMSQTSSPEVETEK